MTTSPYWSQSNGRAEAAVKSAKHILLTAEDVDLALLSTRNSAPAGHTFSPAQRLFGRVLRSDLPQPTSGLEPFTPPRDTVEADHVQRKLKQKNAYDKHASAPLPDIPPGSYVYAKPPPTSLAKAWIPGQVVGPAGPRSYLIDTGGRQIKRNRIQVQLAPSPHHSMDSPSGSQPEPTLPDKLLPNSLTAMTPTSQRPPRTATTFSATPSSVPDNPVSSTVDETPLTASPSPPCSVTQPPTLRQVSPISSSPSLPRPQTVTRSGRVIRRPARYAD